MSKEFNIKNFMNYLSKPLSLEIIKAAYAINNINFQRADLYKDFILTLDYYIIRTYLGDDFTNKPQRLNHFKWCWNKTCNLLNRDGIFFNTNDKVFSYLLDFYNEGFYNLNDKEINQHQIAEVWKIIFNYNSIKSRSELDSFVTLYKLFENSYKI